MSDVNERMILAARVGGLGIWDYDILKGEMVCDAQWHQIMGLDPSHPVTRIEQFRPSVHPEDVDRVTEVDSTAVRLAADRKDYEIEFRIQPADGNIKWIRSAAAIVQDDGGRPVRAVGFVVDITEARLAKDSLEKQSLQDPLTGLGNRRALDEAIQRECIRVECTGDAISVAMIDIDYFKLYNDRSGHLFGDDALRAVANIIAKAARRPYDLAARFGGEEFVLLLPGVADPRTQIALIQSGLAELAIPHPASSLSNMLTVSCGCFVYDGSEKITPAELLEACDKALYQAKARGRNRAEILWKSGRAESLAG